MMKETRMELGMVGLGRMGTNMVRRLLKHGHPCVVYDRNAEAVKNVVEAGAIGVDSPTELVRKMARPRAIWLMIPAAVVDATIAEFVPLLEAGDVLIDGGNSYYVDDIRRAQVLSSMAIHYVDAGTSGGVWGLERGYCLMIGGPREVADKLDSIFATLAPGEGDVVRTAGREGPLSPAERGYVHVGTNGAGHFVKMVHNGIEYGLMQAYAEGFDILRNAASDAKPVEERLELNTADIAEVWRHGSVVSSWLLDVAATALAKDGDLAGYSGFVADSGEGRWTLAAAMEGETPANVLAAALFARFRSRQDDSFADKLLSAMREGFGGHKESKG